MLEQHFVTFLSPGTFVHEETTKKIAGWNVQAALALVASIHERHGATPFAFQFSTRRREDEELDSKVVATSSRYYLGGTVLTLQEVQARNDPGDRILISNMQYNKWDRVIENHNSWKVVQPLGADDIVLDFQRVEKSELQPSGDVV